MRPAPTPRSGLRLRRRFAVIYSVEGAGGYQLFGRSPVPCSTQRLKDFQDSIVFPKPGDIWNYRRIDREEFDRLEAEVEEGTFEYKKKDFVHPDRSLEDPHAYNEEILGVLYGD